MAINPLAKIPDEMQAPPPPALAAMPELTQPASPVLAKQPQTPLQQNITQDQAELQKVRMAKARPFGFKGALPSAEFPEGLAPNHSGKLGKMEHVFSQIGNIAGDVFAPATMANIPGTQMNRQMQEGQLAKRVNEEQSEQAQNEHLGAETENLGASTQKTEADTASAQRAAKVAANAGTIVRDENKRPIGWQDAEGHSYPMDDLNIPQGIRDTMKADTGTRAKTPEELYMREHPAASSAELQNFLAKPISDVDATSRNALFDPIAKKYGLPTGQFRPGMTTAEATAIQTELNNAVGKQQGAQHISISLQGMQNTNNRAEATANRQEVRLHDKAYVQPAESVEKSYQMMDHAYNEFKDAKAKGQDLPTGAQSMLALSTHLATTFGNVKGARVTKDMIAEHLGARSIGDDALVAVQKLTNGDRLSPAQWDAFHDLIKQSRNLSWQTAVKEADRKQIPVDFLPPDLQGTSGNASGSGGGGAGLQITRDANGRITGVK
jgi:hypothetical protein